MHPVDLDVARVGGTKNPDVHRIVQLAPDLVIASEEENREVDVVHLRAQGVPVWVTDIRSLDGAFESMERVLGAIAAPHRDWLSSAREAWSAAAPVSSGERRRAVVAIWRRPWMFLGGIHMPVTSCAGSGRQRPGRPRRAVPTGGPCRAAPARPRHPAGRALPLHGGRRAGGLPGPGDGARRRAGADVVRPTDERRAERAGPAAGSVGAVGPLVDPGSASCGEQSRRPREPGRAGSPGVEDRDQVGLHPWFPELRDVRRHPAAARSSGRWASWRSRSVPIRTTGGVGSGGRGRVHVGHRATTAAASARPRGRTPAPSPR